MWHLEHLLHLWQRWDYRGKPNHVHCSLVNVSYELLDKHCGLVICLQSAVGAAIQSAGIPLAKFALTTQQVSHQLLLWPTPLLHREADAGTVQHRCNQP
jgi:hypothetical protein